VGEGRRETPGNAGKCRKRYPQVRDGVGDFRQVNDRRLKLLIYFRRLRNSTSIKRNCRWPYLMPAKLIAIVLRLIGPKFVGFRSEDKIPIFTHFLWAN